MAFGIGHAHYYGTRDTHYIREKVDSMAIQLMKVDETVHGVANGPDQGLVDKIESLTRRVVDCEKVELYLKE